MSEDSEQTAEQTVSTVETLSHSRILILMAVVALLGTLLGLIFVSVSFGVGVFLGGGLSLLNYYWLRRSIRTVFDEALAGGKPQFLAVRYFLRYATFAAILAVVYLTKTVPVVAVLLGLASFALAIIFEAILRVFKSFSNKKEI